MGEPARAAETAGLRGPLARANPNPNPNPNPSPSPSRVSAPTHEDSFRRVCLLMLVGFFGCAARHGARGAPSLTSRLDSSENLNTAAMSKE